MRPTEIKLNDNPKDAISMVRFAPNTSQFLLASSWDGTVRLYDVIRNELRHKFVHGSPILDATFIDMGHIASASLDNYLRLYDVNTHVETLLGEHGEPIRCVEYAVSINSLLTGSWDKTIKLWDLREKQCVGTYKQYGKVYSMSVNDNILLVATSNRKIIIWDLRKMEQCMMERDSSLKYQIRCIRLFPNKEGYVVSSIEGRVAVEYLNQKREIQKKNYVFKCHRHKQDNVEYVYPVNTISFHNIYNTFATGGSDGFVNVWDAFKKKRLYQFHGYDTTISSLNFNHDGSALAIACSYMNEFEVPPKNLPKPTIYVRYVSKQETKLM